MKYTVLWTPSAEQHLADDRAAVTSASQSIDRLLARNLETQGQSLYDTVRALLVPPLGVDFEVNDQDLIVWVLSAWDTTKTTP